jgi:hypothetical protein
MLSHISGYSTLHIHQFENLTVVQQLTWYSDGAIGWMAEESGFSYCQGKETISYPQHPKRLWRPSCPPTQKLLELVFMWIKRPVREADHSPSYRVEIRNGEAMLPLPHVFMGL